MPLPSTTPPHKRPYNHLGSGLCNGRHLGTPRIRLGGRPRIL